MVALVVPVLCALIGASAKQFLLFASSPVVRVVLRLRQPIRKIQQVLRHPYRTQQIHLRISIIEHLLRKQLLHLLSDNGQFEDLLAAGPELGADLH